MRFSDMNWMDVENYLKHDNRVMIVLGACEQHGYLSLLTDSRIPEAMADAASEKTGVIVAPTINLGVSPYFLDYPGSISLRLTTMINLLEDTVRSLYHSGFRNMLFVNGHGGNTPASTRLVELMNELTGLNSAWYSWWQSDSVTAVAKQHGLQSFHAAWIEAFPFVRVCDLPNEVKTPPQVKGIFGAKETRAIYGDGVFGGPYTVEGTILDEVFQAAVSDICVLLEFNKRD
ncbi:MAG TPA: creatininase family protein [Anaerolineaceae bacterium]